MFQFLGDIIGGAGQFAGGAIKTVAELPGNIVTGTGEFIGSFFPPQKARTVQSNIAEPMGQSDLSYHPADPDAPSIWATNYWRDNMWFGSPYEPELSPTTKRSESTTLSQSVSALAQPSGGLSGLLSDALDLTTGALREAREIRTLYDEFAGIFSGRSPIPEGPSSGSIVNTNQPGIVGADVFTAIGGALGGMFEQVKGLFNIGYDQTSSQPAFAVKHEINPSNKTLTVIIVIAVILAVILIFGRRK